ncbi:MAG: Ig-like domain-containing protein, partial [Butyrivibrio sp.]|nr:Ig-like domain-containing protein [Butyrivibrio sp.]
EETPLVNTVEEKVAVTGIKASKSSIKIGKGGTYQLKSIIYPDNATDVTVTWKSDNTKIATVTGDGLVKAKKIGSTKITVTSNDGNYTATIKVKVVKTTKVTGVKLNKSKKTLKVGKTYTLKATVKPKKATIKDVTWSSSNKKVATVDGNGKVTAKSKGTATITVKTKDGKYTATCKIKVKKK